MTLHRAPVSQNLLELHQIVGPSALATANAPITLRVLDRSVKILVLDLVGLEPNVGSSVIRQCVSVQLDSPVIPLLSVLQRNVRYLK